MKLTTSVSVWQVELFFLTFGQVNVILGRLLRRGKNVKTAHEIVEEEMAKDPPSNFYSNRAGSANEQMRQKFYAVKEIGSTIWGEDDRDAIPEEGFGRILARLCGPSVHVIGYLPDCDGVIKCAGDVALAKRTWKKHLESLREEYNHEHWTWLYPHPRRPRKFITGLSTGPSRAQRIEQASRLLGIPSKEGDAV